MVYNGDTIFLGDDFMNEFGEYLREIRGKRSLRTIESLTGISHTYLSSLEKGYDPRSKKPRSPTPEVIKQLSEGLNIDYYLLMKKAGYLDNRPAHEIIEDVKNKFSNYDFTEMFESGRKEARMKDQISIYMYHKFAEELAIAHSDELKEEIIKKYAKAFQREFNSYDLSKVFSSNSTTYFEGKELTDEQKEKILTVIKAIL